jgi:hypothetical protein
VKEGLMPRYGFPAFSPRGPQEVKDGDRWDEQLSEWNEQSNGPGAVIGKVDLTHSGGTPVEVTAKFEFHNGTEVTYEGNVPGGNTWKGESILHRTGGDPEILGRL